MEAEVGLFGAGGADGLWREGEFYDAAHLGKPPAGALEAVGPEVAIFVADLVSHPEFQLLCVVHIDHSLLRGVGHLWAETERK